MVPWFTALLFALMCGAIGWTVGRYRMKLIVKDGWLKLELTP